MIVYILADEVKLSKQIRQHFRFSFKIWSEYRCGLLQFQAIAWHCASNLCSHIQFIVSLLIFAHLYALICCKHIQDRKLIIQFDSVFLYF